MNNTFVTAREFNGKISTKEQLYRTLEIDLGMVLPPFERCQLSFLKDFIAKKKLTVQRTKAVMLPIPRYKELSTKKVWNFVKEIPELLIYFPEFKDDEIPDRTFMWIILCTLKLDECKKLIEEARKARGQSLEESKNSLIEVHPEILQKLLEAPLISKGRGRVGYLLKQSRPVRNERKVSKEYKPTLQILKMGSSERTNEHAADNTRFEEEKHEETDMNVHYRPESRYQNKAESEFLQQFKREKSKNKERSNLHLSRRPTL